MPRRAAAWAVLLCLAVAGCGSDGNGDGDEQRPGGQETAAGETTGDDENQNESEDVDLAVESEWGPRLSDALESMPEDCQGGVGTGCQAYLTLLEREMTDLGAAIEARDDAASYSEATDAVTEVQGYFDEYLTAGCGFMAPTDPNLMTCSDLFTTLITTVTDTQYALRPSEDS